MTPDFPNQQLPESGFCPQCGTANPRMAAFCAKCGAPLPWAAPKIETVASQAIAPQAVAPVPPTPSAPAPSASQWPASPPPVAPVSPEALQAVYATPPAVPSGVPVVDGFKILLKILFPPELRAAAKGATPQELLRLYGLRIVGLVLLLVLLKSYAYGIVTILAMGALVCLVVGLLNPQAFRGVFGAKTSKATVGWIFGLATLALGAIGSSMEPKAVNPAPIVALASSPVTPSAPAPVSPAAPTSAPVQKTAAQARAEAVIARAARAQAKAQRDLAEKVAQQKQVEREAMVEAQAKARAEREATSLSQSNTVPESNPASSVASKGVTDEMSDVSSGDAWVPDGGQESYRDPRTLKVLLTVQHVGDTTAPIVVKVGNNDFTTWGQTTVTLNYDLLYSLKKASVAAQLNYFYSFPSLKSGHQKTIPMTAFRNAEGSAFDPDQYRLRRIFVESKTLEGRKTWDAHPS